MLHKFRFNQIGYLNMF